MASLIPGYEYDIFISYRQKDNRGERWVSEFVESLKTELESTFKEEISVYFDINPHDGLLETHDVDASLKDKLKCLVFIPIISLLIVILNHSHGSIILLNPLPNKVCLQKLNYIFQ